MIACRSFRISVLTVLLFIFTPITQAKTLPVNPLCADANVAVLSFKSLTHFKNLDYCTMDSEHTPASVRSILSQIGSIHEKISTELGIPRTQLFEGKGAVRIHFFASARGSYASDADDDLDYSAFENFTENQFDDQNYAHELTHYLQNHTQHPLKQWVSGIQYSTVFKESFPDLVDSFVTHETRLLSKEMPPHSCLSEVRDGTPFKPVSTTLYPYTQASLLDHLSRCCSEYVSANPNDLKIIALCTSVTVAFIFQPPLKVSHHLEMTPKNCFQFDPIAHDLTNVCETHQFTPPIVSFFNSLTPHLFNSPLKVLVQALEASSAESITQTCHGRNNPKFKFKITYRTLKPVFEHFRDLLTCNEQAAYDETFLNHRLQIFLDTDEYLQKIDAINTHLNGDGKTGKFSNYTLVNNIICD